LTLSVIIKPSFMAIKDQFLLNMVAALSVRDFIKDKVGHTVCVKWPNDVLVDDLKLCGILIENQIQGEYFTNSVIGIGLNVNQKGFYSKNASSMAMITSREFQLQEVFEQVLASLEKWYIVLKQKDYKKIKQAYLSSLYGVNQTRNFKTRSDVFEGIIRGVDEVGRLMIETQVGTRYFNTKEVQFDFEPFK
ncbi:MAG: biotin--[acetyl-CoA-carboxylase] ligase, partial [Cyclobacteriaceae bacterium]